MPHPSSPGKPSPLPGFPNPLIPSLVRRLDALPVLFEGGELPAEELLHVGPDLVGFRPGEGLQHTFTPAGERVETPGVFRGQGNHKTVPR